MDGQLIPERFAIFPEFPEFREGSRLTPYPEINLKSSMDVAEPLPRACLDTIQKMVAIAHHLTPCCTVETD